MGNASKTAKFGSWTATDGAQRVELPKRRHSHESHTNVYTECGRHSDDWLFGGISVMEAMKRVWGRRN